MNLKLRHRASQQADDAAGERELAQQAALSDEPKPKGEKRRRRTDEKERPAKEPKVVMSKEEKAKRRAKRALGEHRVDDDGRVHLIPDNKERSPKAQKRYEARLAMKEAKVNGEVSTVRIGAGGRPQLHAPRHASTTAHSCTLYPWGVHGSLGFEGVYLGSDTLGGGGSFCFDAFEAYRIFSTSGSATNTNMMVMGQPGMGKSALMKSLLYRTASIYGSKRFLAICDVKSEYTELAEELGIPIVKLAPGGLTRVNPMEVRGSAEHRVVRQTAMMQALASGVLKRPLTQVEDVGLWNAVESLPTDHTTTVADLVQKLTHPSVELAASARMSVEQFTNDTREMTFALQKLMERSLSGMFDGQSTVDIDPYGPGVVIDISAVQHDEEALPLVMVAATAWLQQILTENTEAKKIQVLDECWKMVSFEATARYLQACWKLGRTFGVANVAILHKPGDLSSQSEEGSATAKISAGLIADTAVRVSFQQSTEDLRDYGDLLGFSTAEQYAISDLIRGQSFWKIGTHAVKLSHEIPEGGVEAKLCNTDAAILDECLLA